MKTVAIIYWKFSMRQALFKCLVYTIMIIILSTWTLSLFFLVPGRLRFSKIMWVFQSHTSSSQKNLHLNPYNSVILSNLSIISYGESKPLLSTPSSPATPNLLSLQTDRWRSQDMERSRDFPMTTQFIRARTRVQVLCYPFQGCYILGISRRKKKESWQKI